jgi:hypothetical protein
MSCSKYYTLASEMYNARGVISDELAMTSSFLQQINQNQSNGLTMFYACLPQTKLGNTRKLFSSFFPSFSW